MELHIKAFSRNMSLHYHCLWYLGARET